MAVFAPIKVLGDTQISYINADRIVRIAPTTGERTNLHMVGGSTLTIEGYIARVIEDIRTAKLRSQK